METASKMDDIMDRKRMGDPLRGYLMVIEHSNEPAHELIRKSIATVYDLVQLLEGPNV